MNVLIVVGGAMSALVVILFVYVVYLVGGVGLDGPFFSAWSVYDSLSAM